MVTLLQSSTPDTYQQNRKLTRRDVHGVPPRWRFVLELHMTGHLPTKVRKRIVIEDDKPVEKVTHHSIHELTGYSPAMIHRILANEDIIGLRQQIMCYYDDEFQAMYPEVIDAVRRGLDSHDKYLEAAKIYLKEFGSQSKGTGGGDGMQVNFTAEDMVFQILQQRGNDGNDS